MPLPPATRLGSYEILAPLGAGGMGEVYRAKDLKLGREVALKVLQADLASDPAFLERFRREARALAALDHPAIVVVFSAEEADGVHFLTMQLVAGQTLDRLIPEGGMPVEQLLAIASMLGDALAAAHAKGILHRDVKPSNVVVTPDGRAKVLDFGLARPMSSEPTRASAASTRTGAIVGTLPYMSPEQLTGHAVDHRTDIFSMGVTLYEMATGRRPFEGRSNAELVSSILRDEPRPLLDLRPGLPDALAELVEGCLAKDPQGRPASAREIRDRCDSLRREIDGRRAVGVTRAADRHHASGNLPSSLDSFVAREEELASVISLLEDTRLVTLTGVGGTGKTRLAIEAAHRLAERFPDGAWLVELAPVSHAAAVPNVLGDLLGIRQEPGRTLAQSLVDALRLRSLLLVLDNCEHVLDAAAELVTSITRHCTNVRILATSREALGISGERVLRLLSLTDAEGAQLFRDRALAAGAFGNLDIATLARLSQRLDGMPLAIELAAARCSTMLPEEIERRLDHRFQLLRGTRRGRIERHQTLHQTVAWSYELLESQEQHVFDRLSVFANGFTLEAAQAVASGDDIDPLQVEEAVTALVARSMMLALKSEKVTRYRLLETLRQFGEERLLSSGDATGVRRRHVRYFADFMSRAWSGLWSADASYWIRAVGREFEDLRVAVYSAVDLREREALAALLKPHYFWAWHSLRYEVGDWAEAALDVTPEPDFARLVAVHLRVHGGRPQDATRLAAQLRDQEDAGDPDAACLTALGHMSAAVATRGPDVAEWVRRALVAAEHTGNRALATLLKSMQVLPRVIAGEMDEARRIASEAYDQAKAIGNPITLCEAMFFMGCAHADSDPEMALRYFDRTAELAEKNALPFYAGIAATEAAAASARVEEAGLSGARLSRALRAFIHSGDRGQLWNSAHHLVYFLVRTQRPEEALRIWRELGDRRAYVAQHLRDELTRLIGPPGKGTLSDDELIDRIVEVLDRLDRGA